MEDLTNHSTPNILGNGIYIGMLCIAVGVRTIIILQKIIMLFVYAHCLRNYALILLTSKTPQKHNNMLKHPSENLT